MVIYLGFSLVSLEVLSVSVRFCSVLPSLCGHDRQPQLKDNMPIKLDSLLKVA